MTFLALKNLQRLVDMLEEKTHLPAVLQSLGCIAQTAMSVFETRESEIEGYIKGKVLECNNVGHPSSAGFLQPMISSLFFSILQHFFNLRNAFSISESGRSRKPMLG